ncbi:MAG: UDP-glucose/GDP-mannose dehydrogenase family protein [Chlamydiota bacterium]|nr:UDP-glucose/GDP-mannose dehydrogenase family protein [Chlamydiota bacterium]
MDLLIIGVGYVGLVTGCCMAEMGHNVTCLDIDQKKIDELKQGHVPFYESGLEGLVQRNVSANRLHFTTQYKEAVASSEVCFICVDTPTGDTGHANLKYVEGVARAIAENMDSYKIVVNKSTVPVGTAEVVRKIIAETLKSREVNVSFDVVSNPEFLAEGNAVADCMKPDRVILGIDNEDVGKKMHDIYSPFMLSHDRVITMDIPSAEMTKYAANIMLASRVSLMNELAGLCETVGANIDFVRVGIGSDNRIGYKFIYPGLGFGGSCLPKDLRALQALAKDNKYETPLLAAIEEVNHRQKRSLGKKVIDYFTSRNSPSGKTVGVLGLSFKPDTDDMREAPSLILIDQLLEAGCKVRVFDPIAMDKARDIIGSNPNITWCANEKEVALGAHAIVLVTEWKQFRLLNLKELLANMVGHAFFDGRNQYSPQKMQEVGFDYFSIGKSPVFQPEETTIY